MTASYFFGHVTVWYGEKTYVYACVSALEGVSCEEDKRQWHGASVCYESVEEGHTERLDILFHTLLCLDGGMVEAGTG